MNGIPTQKQTVSPYRHNRTQQRPGISRILDRIGSNPQESFGLKTEVTQCRSIHSYNPRDSIGMLGCHPLR